MANTKINDYMQSTGTYSYGDNGLMNKSKDEYIPKTRTEVVEVLIKALGTMVLMPQYESDPMVIGSKTYTGNLQLPILLGDNREIVENKLLELIKNL